MKYFYSIFLLSVSISCSQPQTVKDEPIVIDPEKFPEEQITMAEIANDIIYVPLDDAIPIGVKYSFEITSNNIYLSMKDVGIVQYDRQGNYVRIIARQGRGPGELQYGFNFTIDQENDIVYIIDRSKILSYSINGSFLKEFSTATYFSVMANNIELIDSKIFLCDYGHGGDLRYHWIFLDTAGNLITKKISSDHSTGYIAYGLSYKFKDKLYYSNILNDTIFSISSDLKVQAAYLFSKGEYRWPIDFQFNSIEQVLGFFKPVEMFESKNFVFLGYSYFDKAALLIINKETNKMYKASKDEGIGFVKTIPYIKNDLDCGLPATRDISYYTEKGIEYIVYLINPFELKTLVVSEEFKNSTPKYPEKKKELEQLANSLTENGNPILMFVRLKD